MQEFIDACYVLGVPAHATRYECRRAHKRLCAVYHPDKGGDSETMAAINNAYDIVNAHFEEVEDEERVATDAAREEKRQAHIMQVYVHIQHKRDATTKTETDVIDVDELELVEADKQNKVFIRPKAKDMTRLAEMLTSRLGAYSPLLPKDSISSDDLAYCDVRDVAVGHLGSIGTVYVDFHVVANVRLLRDMLVDDRDMLDAEKKEVAETCIAAQMRSFIERDARDIAEMLDFDQLDIAAVVTPITGCAGTDKAAARMFRKIVETHPHWKGFSS